MTDLTKDAKESVLEIQVNANMSGHDICPFEPVENGYQAIEVFKAEEDIRVVLMDIQLPKLTGLEVTRMIRESDPDVPIIATTANVFDEDKEACEIAGCTDFITKPINFSELLDLLKEYLH